MSKRSLPWLQFYPSDWQSDAVAGCSLAGQGLWLNMMFAMHTSRAYGRLEVEGKPIPDEVLFRRLGCASVEEYRALLAELFSAGVPSRDSDGIIYSRRMVRDQSERDATAQRVRRHRERAPCNAPVTPLSQGEVRSQSQKSEVREKQHRAAKPAPPCAPTPDPLEQGTKEAGFSVFWEKWPRCQAKSSARQAWMKIPVGEYAAILQGLEKWSVSDQWKRGVVPHAATWLNQKRWQDEDVPIKGGNNGNLSAEERIRLGDAAAENFLRNNRGVAPGVRSSAVPTKSESETLN